MAGLSGVLLMLLVGAPKVVDQPYGLVHHRLANTPRKLWAEPALSPDGTRVAYTEDAPDADELRALVLVGCDGKGVLRREGCFRFPAWSPHGKRLAFCDSQGDLYTMRPDGSDCAVRAHGLRQGADAPFAWSPSGSLLAWVREQDQALWVCEADGARAREVRRQAGGLEFKWAARSDLLICRVGAKLDAHGDERFTRVEVVSTDGGVAVPVRPPVAGLELAAADLSPDGERWALLCFEPREQQLSLWLRGPAGQPDRRLWRRRSGWYSEVRWSPDGTRLVTCRCFAGADNGDSEELDLWTADGAAICRPFPGRVPMWSPNGKRLAYYRPGDGAGAILWVCNNGGLRRTELGEVGDPAWVAFTPDGTHLLVSDAERVDRIELRP